MKKLKGLFVALSVTAFVASAFLLTGCSSSKLESKSSGNQLVMDSSIKQGKLDNGMSYFIRENGEPKNRIQLRLVVKTGSCMEEDDQKGVAHFVEHLCFNGSEHFEVRPRSEAGCRPGRIQGPGRVLDLPCGRLGSQPHGHRLPDHPRRHHRRP